MKRALSIAVALALLALALATEGCKWMNLVK